MILSRNLKPDPFVYTIVSAVGPGFLCPTKRPGSSLRLALAVLIVIIGGHYRHPHKLFDITAGGAGGFFRREYASRARQGAGDWV